MSTLIYTRASTDEQAAKGISLEHQAAKAQTYCGPVRADPVPDHLRQRKIRQELEAPRYPAGDHAVSRQEGEHVIVYDLSRLTRSTRDLLYLIEEVFHKRKNKFVDI